MYEIKTNSAMSDRPFFVQTWLANKQLRIVCKCGELDQLSPPLRKRASTKRNVRKEAPVFPVFGNRSCREKGPKCLTNKIEKNCFNTANGLPPVTRSIFDWVKLVNYYAVGPVLLGWFTSLRDSYTFDYLVTPVYQFLQWKFSQLFISEVGT